MAEKKPKKQYLTVAEMKQNLDQVAAKDPRMPVMIGQCVCGSRMIAFQYAFEANCPKCGGGVEVSPMIKKVSA